MGTQTLQFDKPTRPKKYKGTLGLKTAAKVKITELDETFAPGQDEKGELRKIKLKYELENPQNRLSGRLEVFAKEADASDPKKAIFVEELAPEYSEKGTHDDFSWSGVQNRGEKSSEKIEYKEDAYCLKISLVYKDKVVASDQKSFKVEAPELLSLGWLGTPAPENEGVPGGKAIATPDGSSALLSVAWSGIPWSGTEPKPSGKKVKADTRSQELLSVGWLGAPFSAMGIAAAGKAIEWAPKDSGLVSVGWRGAPAPELGLVDAKGKKVPLPGKLIKAAWSAEKSLPDDEVGLIIHGDDKVSDGTEVTLEISLKKPGGETEVVETLTATMKKYKASAKWRAVYKKVKPAGEAATVNQASSGSPTPPDSATTPSAREKTEEPATKDFRKIPHPIYVFTAKAKCCQPATSGDLKVAAIIGGTALGLYEDDLPDPEVVLAHTRFKLTYKPDYEVVSQTDEGGRFRFEDVPPGEYEFSLLREKILLCRWDKEKGRPGDKAKLQVYVSDEVADGTEVKLKIWEQDADGENDPVDGGELSAPVKEGMAEVEWDVVYMEDTDDVLSAQEETWRSEGFAQFSLPEYIFEATCDGAKAVSGVLTISDVLHGVLEYDDGKPVTDQPFALIFKGGKIKSKTDSKGRYYLDKVPPGQYELELLPKPEKVKKTPEIKPLPELAQPKAAAKTMSSSPGPEGEPPLGRFTNVRWSKDKARPDETVQITFDADKNVPPDTEVELVLWEEDKGGEDDKVPCEPLRAKVENGRGRAEWKVIYMEDTDDKLSSEEIQWQKQGVEQFSLPEFYARLSASDCEDARTGILTISDILEGVLNYDDGTPVANQAIRVTHKGGAIETTTDETGAYKFENVPPGEFSLEFL